MVTMISHYLVLQTIDVIVMQYLRLKVGLIPKLGLDVELSQQKVGIFVLNGLMDPLLGFH